MRSHRIYLFVLTLIIFERSNQLWAQESDDSYGGDDNSSIDGSEVLCSKAGTCICRFEGLDVTVKCTSAGDKLDKIVSDLPPTTTHL